MSNRTARNSRLKSMWLRRLAIFLAVAWLASAAPSGPAIAKRLAERARMARDAGEVVRAYMLYNEAARRDPVRSVLSRPAAMALAPAANLLMKTQLEDPVVAADIAAVEKEETEAEAAAQSAAPGHRGTAAQPGIVSPHSGRKTFGAILISVATKFR